MLLAYQNAETFNEIQFVSPNHGCG